MGVERAVVAAVGALVLSTGWVVSTADHLARPYWQGGWLILGVSCAALLWRRTRPIVAVAVTGVCMALYYVLGFAGGPEPVPFVLALFAVVTGGHRVIALAAATGCLALTQGVVLVRGEPVDVREAVAVAAVLALVLAVGEIVRARRAYLVESAALAERLRIARELHDVVTHHLAVISVQANAALLGRDVEPVAALEAIKQASSAASRELRGALGVLREPAGLTGIHRLVDRVRAVGVDVRLRLTGEPRPLPTLVDLAGYRILQEALTNVVRHAPESIVDVEIGYRAAALDIAVVNSGHGLRGMRERAEAVGGTCTAGPQDGGFAVRAELPR